MKALVLAEKPSVARDIARVLGCHTNISGAIEGERYVVTWGLGHLVTLADPEEYDPKYKEWKLEDLPMMPQPFKLEVIRQTGKQYQIRFRADTLEVVEKARGPETLRLIPGSNLLSCESSESIENLVTSVAVYDEEYRRIATYDSTEGLRALYGLMQQAIKASDKEDPAKSARQILEENGVKTTITAKCLGNTKLITGNAVVVHEPVTGTDGLFWILSDSHTTVSGVYQTTVTLDFRNLMDKQEAGSVPTE